MIGHRAIRHGDLEMVGDPPPKLAGAFAVIAASLHPAFARARWIEHRDKSKESCVLSSLAVRDFLVSIGFITAQVRPVATVVRLMRGEEQVHSLGIGIPGALPNTARNWNGHMVVTVDGFLFDATLYRARRKQWPHLAGMLVLPLEGPADPNYRAYGMKPIAGIGLVYDDPGYLFEIMYLDNGTNTSWQRGGDTEERRREAAVKAMRKRFGP